MKTHIRSLYLICFSLFILSCTSREDLRPKRDCLIEELLLSQSDYPPETIINASRSPIAEKPLESAGGSASYNGDATSQLVARHFSVENAIAEYEKWEKIAFDSDDIVGVWETPEIFDLKQFSANQHKIACSNVISFGQRCYLIGQYEEYFVFFWADVSSMGINLELFLDLVTSIDEEMASCLER